MTAAGWAIALGVWVVAATLLAPIVGRMAKAADPGEDDRDWLADQPAEILVGAELDGRFYGIVAREFYI